MEKSMQLTEEKQAKRERLAWYLYDFGNSAYAGVVLLAVYSAYFKGTVVGGARGTWLWGLSIGIAMLVVAVISPILGSLADFSASKKKFLFIFTAISVFFTAMLFFVTPGSVFTGMLFFILAEIGYRGARFFTIHCCRKSVRLKIWIRFPGMAGQSDRLGVCFAY